MSCLSFWIAPPALYGLGCVSRRAASLSVPSSSSLSLACEHEAQEITVTSVLLSSGSLLQFRMERAQQSSSIRCLYSMLALSTNKKPFCLQISEDFWGVAGSSIAVFLGVVGSSIGVKVLQSTGKAIEESH